MLTVAYDGTAYKGWQLQAGAETIESVLNRCLSELTGETVEVIGASRTDSGVHALGNVAVFDTESPIPAEKFSYALNQRLPEDIRIRGSKEVAADFHPRRCESIKTYEYRICNAAFPLPTRRLYAHFTYVPLDVDLMRQAAAYLVGEHDFKSFCSADTQAKTTVRKIETIEVREEPLADSGTAMTLVTANDAEKHIFPEREIVICVRGRGFLYNMVRIIAGTLMEAGRGQIPPERVGEILLACDRQAAGPTAPACGLTLIGYEFLEKPVDTRGTV
ncbi:MAG: tRNA pseudouridine(38-40) synthase TruA [Bacteroidales bacterium]|nr:tRNA pseudouridine(38-40) synthase TruA [Bacteroidales bacterium]